MGSKRPRDPVYRMVRLAREIEKLPDFEWRYLRNREEERREERRMVAMAEKPRQGCPPGEPVAECGAKEIPF